MNVENDVQKFRKTLMSGFYDVLVLLILDKNPQPMYGYIISKRIEELSGGKIKLIVGTLYPILKKLEKKKLIKGFWAESDQGPPRKYYRITEKGREFLNSVLKIIDEIIELFDRIRGDSLA